MDNTHNAGHHTEPNDVSPAPLHHGMGEDVATTEHEPGSGPLTRRSALALAAFSVPAVVMSVAAPAAAASGQAQLRLLLPGPAAPGDTLTDVRATLRDAAGNIAPGTPVQFSIDPVSVGAFTVGDAATYTARTNALSMATAGAIAIASAGTLTVTATALGAIDVGTIEVQAGTTPSVISFGSSSYSGETGSQISVGGTVTASSTGSRPSSVSLAYAGGFSGPAAASVNASGAFAASVSAPSSPGSGSVTASATGARSGSATLTARAASYAFVFEVYNEQLGVWSAYTPPRLGYIVAGGTTPLVVRCRYRFTSASAPRAVTYDGAFSPYTVPGSVAVSGGIAEFTVQIPAAGGPDISRGILLDGTSSGTSLRIVRVG